MKYKKNILQNTFFFLLTALLIGAFFPKEGSFRYQFFEGKPWHYGLLTAPHDFPIYKTDQEITDEKDSVLRSFEPYFKMEAEVEAEQTANWLRHCDEARPEISITCRHYVEEALERVYDKGILSFITLQEWGDTSRTVRVTHNNVSQTCSLSDFYTIRTAYEYIIGHCPRGIEKSALQAMDINRYLMDNVYYDPITSDRVLEEMLGALSLSNGMVQAGERIVDRGEIINAETYNVLRSLKTIHETRAGGSKVQTIQTSAVMLLICCILFCYWLYLRSFRPRIFINRRHTLFLLLCIFTACVGTEMCLAFGFVSVYILPYAIVPIMVCTFFDSRTALFTHLVIVLICSIMAPFPHEFLLMQVIAGMVVNYILKDLSSRSQLIRCAGIIFLSYAICYSCLTLYQQNDLMKLNGMMYAYFGINFLLLMFAYPLEYMMERVFGYISPVTLVELSNINNPLLKRLSETAPGTFQHSLQVSILASEAADAIGANAALVRTGAMYHDIGKVIHPAFFTENLHHINPHDKLTLEQSAQIIIGHVPEGLRLAAKEGLPEAITRFIHTHHGRGKAKYFYNTYRNQHPGEAVDEALFSYPGPNPFSKETAILMMADAVEAASRSLTEHTEENISNQVNRIVDTQMADGLLKQSPLTFREIDKCKQVFIARLKIIYHTRISYPDAIAKPPTD